MARRSPEKQVELEKNFAIAEAINDYFSARDLGSFVVDGYDPLVEIYEWERQRVRKYYQQRRLDLLQNKVGRYFSSSNTSLIEFIKERTGFEPDAPSELPDFHVSTLKPVFSETYEQGDLLVENVVFASGGGKKPNFQFIKSPDGLKTILLDVHKSKTISRTNFHLHFPNGFGLITQINAVSPNISASWKDNYTVVIRSSPDFEAPVRIHKVESHCDRVMIIYEDIPAIN